MPRCPKCGKEVSQLKNYCAAQAVYIMTVSEQGDAEYVEDRFVYDAFSDDQEFACPECGEVLCTEEKDAIAFLREGRIPERLLKEVADGEAVHSR